MNDARAAMAGSWSPIKGNSACPRQPQIAYWNLFCLGQALLPLIGEQELAIAALASFKTVFPAAYKKQMHAKLGLVDRDSHSGTAAQDRTLIEDILKLLAKDQVDYTIFWRRLSHSRSGTHTEPVRELFLDQQAAAAWLRRYAERMAPIAPTLAANLMLKTNPKFVLRNHLGEQAIQAAKLKDFSQVDTLLMLLESPFEEHPGFDEYADFPPDWASRIEISCSS